MTIKVVGKLPDPFYNGSKRNTKVTTPEVDEVTGIDADFDASSNPNRYTYRIGVVQQIIRDVVKHPNQWVLVREASKNRSSLAPTLQKYKQIRFSTRKRTDGLFDIYVMYTPDEHGNPDPILERSLSEWSEREKKAVVRFAGAQKAGI